MGCGQKAVSDDEDNWEFLVKKHKLPGNWGLYSREHRHAVLLSNQGFEGRRLKLMVKHRLEHEDLKLKHEKELKELAELEYLENKYE